jgi:MFS family permease
VNLHHPPAGTIRAALRYPAFRWLAAGLTVSMLGDWLYNLALITLVYQDTHSPLWAGITTIVRVVPVVALMPFGGVIADRFDRRRVMVTCDLIRLALMVLLAFVALAHLPVVLAPLVAAAATCAAAPYLPCVSATTPRLVPDADLPGANATQAAISSMAVMVGPALGGVLLLLGSPALAFLVNGATFGLSALAVLAIPAGDAFRPAPSHQRPTGLLRGVADGAAVLRSHPQALPLVGAGFMTTLVYGMQTVLLILVARQDGLGLHGYGYLFAAIGAGALAGTALGSRALRWPHPRAVLAAGLAACGLPMALLAVAHWPAVAIVLVALTGAGNSVVEVLSETRLQRILPPEAYGRAFGLALPAILSGIVVGAFVAPLLIRVLGSSGALVACAAVVAGYAMALLPRPGLPATRRQAARRRLASRRTAPIGVLAAVAALVLGLLIGHAPKLGQVAARQPSHAAPGQGTTALTVGAYPGQQQRGVFQTVNRIVASGNTIVTMGSQTSDGLVRQQFFVSTDGGATWRLAPVSAPGGGTPPLGHPAARLAGGPGGWLAVGPQAIWTSPNGLSWTLAAAHGITPMRPGDQMWVLNSTSAGFLAAGVAAAPGHATQAVVWTSRDGVTWQRKTAAQLGLAGPGQTVQSISYITSRGPDTVMSGQVTRDGTSYAGVWLSTDGGSAWTRVTVPAGHGAATAITGLGSDAAGLLAVRPGRSASGAGDAVAYFSPNGRGWQYAGTIGASAAWTPGLVKGSEAGFIVAGTGAAGQLVAYTSTGTGWTWQPTGSLGDAGTQSVVGATVAAAGTIVAVGYTSPSTVSQQPVFLEADTAGRVRPVPLASIPGGSIPELAVNGLTVAVGQQIAVGSSEGYPAVWRKASGRSWSLVTLLSQVSAIPGLEALTAVTHGPSGWLAVGAPGPVIMTSADGATWQSATGPGSITAGLAGVSGVAAAAGPHGYVIAGKLAAPGGGCVADVWWSPNLTSWTRADDVNDVAGSSQVLAVAADAGGFVSAGSHDGKPAVWITTDGTTWTTIVLPVPAGASSAVLQQIAISGNRVAALGQATTPAGTVPIAELSVNGGTSWHQVPFSAPGPDTALTALTASAGGFTAAGQFGAPGQRQVAAWTSANGTSWTPAAIGGLTGTQTGGSYQISALAPSGAAVTGIGSLATQASQEVFTVTLPAH